MGFVLTSQEAKVGESFQLHGRNVIKTHCFDQRACRHGVLRGMMEYLSCVRLKVFDVSEILDGVLRIIKSGGNVLNIKVCGGRTFWYHKIQLKFNNWTVR